METIRGRKSLELDLNGLTERLVGYNRIMLDLGTGDGRYVHHLAEKFPNHFIIGIDSCRENLREVSQKKLANMLFVIASAQALPYELNGLVSHISINFPWGSLLESLLENDTSLMSGLESIAGFNTSMEIRLNSGALAEAGTTLEHGAQKIYVTLTHAGWSVDFRKPVDALRTFPTTWARRLAHGRDPRTLILNGHLAYRTQNVIREVARIW
jgi:16S rRNA (adenine(1408)-N(1))-methyltransferase